MSTITASAPPFLTNLLNAAGNKVRPAGFPRSQEEITFTQWYTGSMVPSATTGIINPIAGSSAGFTSVVIDVAAATAMSGGKFFAFSGKLKDGATTALLDNIIVLSNYGSELGRIRVEAASQRVGWSGWMVPGDLVDARVLVEAAASAVSGGAIEADDNIYTKTAHGLVTGQSVILTSLTGGTGLTAALPYFFSKIDANTGYLCSTLANAFAATAINVTLDASSVVLTPVNGLVFSATVADPALELGWILGGIAD